MYYIDDNASLVTERLAEVLNNHPKLHLPSFVRSWSIALAKIVAGGIVICATSFLIVVVILHQVVGSEAVDLVVKRVTERTTVVFPGIYYNSLGDAD